MCVSQARLPVGENRADVKPGGPGRLMRNRPVAASRTLTVPSYADCCDEPAVRAEINVARLAGLDPRLRSANVPDPDGPIVSGAHDTVARAKAEVEHARELTTHDVEPGGPPATLYTRITPSFPLTA